MASDLDQLLEMGFDKERAELAVKQSGGLQGAMDWLEKTQDDPLDELKEEAEENARNAAESDEPKPNSWVCNDCGVKLRNEVELNYHAVASKHENFEQSDEVIPPKTKEEIEQMIKAKREKMAGKRDAEAKEAQKRNEQIRLKANKETQDLKEEMAKKEQINQAAKKRQDKAEEAEAKKRALARIKGNQEDRRRKEAAEKARRDGLPDPGVSSATPVAAATPSSSKASHDEARLRIEMPDGSKVMMKLPADKTLRDLSQQLQKDHGVAEVVQLEMVFPKKLFSSGEFDQTLKDAGLTPSANLRCKTG